METYLEMNKQVLNVFLNAEESFKEDLDIPVNEPEMLHK